ncbi:MAG: TetR/AcrR family transcriptional regulator C-terminal domain-containing protein [Erysipelotrichaceae bacterium]|nr:TetR/AcrR family transcriptional regulator C-terminal domain-containing protein [Erysipelotrichaceae bacterium]
MKTKALDKITVTEIVERCGTTRQTFYRNFKDKYELVNWYFQSVSVSKFESYARSGDFKTALYLKHEMISNEYHFYREASNSFDINSLQNYDYNSMMKTCSEIIEAKLHAPLSTELRVILSVYCHGCIDVTTEWVRKGMPFTSQQIASYLWKAMPSQLKNYLV